MFEVLKYRKQFEVLSPVERNQVLARIVDSVPVNTPIYEISDFSEAEKFWGFNPGELDESFGQRSLYDLLTPAVEYRRANSEMGKIMKYKLRALMHFAYISSYYGKKLRSEIEGPLEAGVYKEYPLDQDNTPIGVAYYDYEYFEKFKEGLFPVDPETDAGIFLPESGLSIETQAFIEERNRVRRRIADFWSRGLDVKTYTKDDSRKLDLWRRSLIKFHKVVPESIK